MLYYWITAFLAATAAFASEIEVVTYTPAYPFLNTVYGEYLNFEVSTVTVLNHTTTYTVTCRSKNAWGCGFETSGAKVISGPSTIAMTSSNDGVTYTAGCKPTTSPNRTSPVAACTTTMYGPSWHITISDVHTWSANVMSMFATGTQDTPVTETWTYGNPTTTQAVATTPTATSTSGTLKELEVTRWCFFSAVGSLFALALV